MHTFNITDYGARPGSHDYGRRPARSDATPAVRRNITVDSNTFDAFDLRLLKAHCVDGLTVTNNFIHPSDQYPAAPPPAEPFDITDCRHVTVAGNVFAEPPVNA